MCDRHSCRRFGKISVRRHDLPEFLSVKPGRSRPVAEQYTWRPLKVMRHDLFANFELQMNSLKIPEYGRTFRSSAGPLGFALLASLGGAAILNQREKLGAPARFSYHAMRLVFQLAPRLRECFRRDFKKEQDLYLPRSEGDVLLPSDVGLSSSGRGTPWSPAELIRQGKLRAKDLERPKRVSSAAFHIRLGLLEAAKMNPIDVAALAPDDALTVVRLGLFDIGPGEKPSQEETRQVTERLLGALENHLEDDTAAFTRWFTGQIDNLVHQIAKKRRPGGPMDRELVRRAVLELVFDSFRYIGDCVHLLMQDFARALPGKKALNRRERARFDLMFMKQPWLGGLPLILLHHRFDFLDEALHELYADPTDPVRRGALLRLLSWYGAMASRRREVDRDQKRLGHHRNARNRRATHETIREHTAVAPGKSEFQEIALSMLDARNIRCRCRGQGCWDAGLVKRNNDKKLSILKYHCHDCGSEGSIVVTDQEFRSAGQRPQ